MGPGESWKSPGFFVSKRVGTLTVGWLSRMAADDGWKKLRN